MRKARFPKILLALAAAICIFIAVLLVVLHSSPGRRAVLRRVTALLAQQNIQVQTDGLDYNLFGLSLSLRNLVLRSPDAPQLPAFATVEQLDLKLSLPDLVRRKFVIRTGQIAGADIKYVIDERGLDNVPHPPRDPEQADEPLNYLISDLSISRTQVQYEDRRRALAVTVPLPSITVTGDRLADRHTIVAEAGSGSLRTKDQSIAFDRASAKIDVGRNDLRVEALQLDAEGSRIDASGTVKDFDAPELALAVKSQLDLDRLSQMLQLADPARGRALVEATVNGPADAAVIEARIDSSNLAYRTFEEVQVAATGKYDVGTRLATIDRLDLRAPWGWVTGSGEIAADAAHASQVRATVTGLDARTVMQGLELPYRIASRLDAQVNAQWPGLDYLDARGDARVSLTPNAPASRGVIPVGGQLDLRGQDGAIAARIRSLTAAGATANGTLRVTADRRLSGQVTTTLADVGGTAARLEAVLGQARGSLLPARVQGPATVRATVGGSVSSPAVAARIDAPALAVENARDIAVSGQVAYTPAALTIEGAEVTWAPQGAAVAGPARALVSGRVELAGARRLDLKLQATQLDLPSIVAAAGQSLPVSGTLAIDATARGSTASPIVDLHARGERLVAYSEPWGTLDATGTLADRIFNLARLHIDKPQPEGNGELVATGRYDLSRSAYAFEVNSTNVRLLEFTPSEGQTLQGDITLAARGEGTIADPAADVDLSSKALRLNDRALGPVAVDGDVRDRQRHRAPDCRAIRHGGRSADRRPASVRHDAARRAEEPGSGEHRRCRGPGDGDAADRTGAGRGGRDRFADRSRIGARHREHQRVQGRLERPALRTRRARGDSLRRREGRDRSSPRDRAGFDDRRGGRDSGHGAGRRRRAHSRGKGQPRDARAVLAARHRHRG